MKLLFHCPKCESANLEMIEDNVTVTSQIVSIHKDGDVTFGETSNGGDSYIDRYQCANCGFVLPDVTSEFYLVEYLVKNPPPFIKVKPDYRNKTEYGEYQFIVEYTSGGASGCSHVSFEDVEKLFQEQYAHYGDGRLVDDGEYLVWHLLNVNEKDCNNAK